MGMTAATCRVCGGCYAGLLKEVLAVLVWGAVTEGVEGEATQRLCARQGSDSWPCFLDESPIMPALLRRAFIITAIIAAQLFIAGLVVLCIRAKV